MKFCPAQQCVPIWYLLLLCGACMFVVVGGSLNDFLHHVQQAQRQLGLPPPPVVPAPRPQVQRERRNVVKRPGAYYERADDDDAVGLRGPGPGEQSFEDVGDEALRDDEAYDEAAILRELQRINAKHESQDKEPRDTERKLTKRNRRQKPQQFSPSEYDEEATPRHILGGRQVLSADGWVGEEDMIAQPMLRGESTVVGAGNRMDIPSVYQSLETYGDAQVGRRSGKHTQGYQNYSNNIDQSSQITNNEEELHQPDHLEISNKISAEDVAPDQDEESEKNTQQTHNSWNEDQRSQSDHSHDINGRMQQDHHSDTNSLQNTKENADFDLEPNYQSHTLETATTKLYENLKSDYTERNFSGRSGFHMQSGGRIRRLPQKLELNHFEIDPYYQYPDYGTPSLDTIDLSAENKHAYLKKQANKVKENHNNNIPYVSTNSRRYLKENPFIKEPLVTSLREPSKNKQADDKKDGSDIEDVNSYLQRSLNHLSFKYEDNPLINIEVSNAKGEKTRDNTGDLGTESAHKRNGAPGKMLLPTALSHRRRSGSPKRRFLLEEIPRRYGTKLSALESHLGKPDSHENSYNFFWHQGEDTGMDKNTVEHRADRSGGKSSHPTKCTRHGRGGKCGQGFWFGDDDEEYEDQDQNEAAVDNGPEKEENVCAEHEGWFHSLRNSLKCLLSGKGCVEDESESIETQKKDLENEAKLSLPEQTSVDDLINGNFSGDLLDEVLHDVKANEPMCKQVCPYVSNDRVLPQLETAPLGLGEDAGGNCSGPGCPEDLVAKLSNAISGIVEEEVRAARCQSLPRSLRSFIQWLLDGATEELRPQNPRFVDGKNLAFYSAYYEEPPPSVPPLPPTMSPPPTEEPTTKPSGQVPSKNGSAGSSGDHGNAELSDELERKIRLLKQLLEEYHKLSAQEQTKVQLVADYLQSQLTELEALLKKQQEQASEATEAPPLPSGEQSPPAETNREASTEVTPIIPIPTVPGTEATMEDVAKVEEELGLLEKKEEIPQETAAAFAPESAAAFAPGNARNWSEGAAETAGNGSEGAAETVGNGSEGATEETSSDEQELIQKDLEMLGLGNSSTFGETFDFSGINKEAKEEEGDRSALRKRRASQAGQRHPAVDASLAELENGTAINRR